MQLTVLAEHAVSELKSMGPQHVNDLINYCEKPKLCPYELSAFMVKDAQVVIADYNMIFHPSVRDSLFSRASKKLSDCIIVVDEGHNLPARCRELLTSKLSFFMLDRALQEANKFEFFSLLAKLQQLKSAMQYLGKDLNFNKEEKLLRKYEFIDSIEKYDQLIEDCKKIGEDIKEKQKQSFVHSIGEFLEHWMGSDKEYARILQKDEKGNLSLHYKCLDPSLLTRAVIDQAYATIVMSGTLLPTFMYKDLLGFSQCEELTLENPFPPENRLCLIVPETTTKFSRRGEEEYKYIAASCNRIIENIPGNVTLFFPSYLLRDKVYKYLYSMCKRKMLIEKQQMNKNEREELIEEFKAHKDGGAVLLGVSSGSFGEGIDLPGDLLKGVVVVGLPLEKPDLETTELIDFYEDKYGKGMDYGYIFPAFTKCLQNAGRCIRSEIDRGVIVFLDERFAWSNYMRCFPKDMEIKISKMYEERIKEFFKKG